MGRGNHHRNNNNFHQKLAWNTGEEKKECKNCDFQPNAEKGYAIKIHPNVFSAIFHLCDKVETEWQMLLKGGETETEVIVNGYYIPKQEVTSSTVKNLDAIDEEFIIENDIIATIHSHSNMGVFFSHTDDEFTNMSHIRHHIVVNNRHELVAKSRYDLPCGMAKFATSKVMSLVPSIESVEGIENIIKKAHIGFQTGGVQHYKGRRLITEKLKKVADSEDHEFVRNKWNVWVIKRSLSPMDILELEALEEEQENEDLKNTGGQLEYLPPNGE